MTRKMAAMWYRIYFFCAYIYKNSPWKDFGAYMPLICVPESGDTVMYRTACGEDGAARAEYFLSPDDFYSENAVPAVKIFWDGEDAGADIYAFISRVGVNIDDVQPLPQFEINGAERRAPDMTREETAAVLDFAGNLFMMLNAYYERGLNRKRRKRDTLLREYKGNGDWQTSLAEPGKMREK